MSAFANTEGGIIILGLDESEGFTASEHFDIEKARNQFLSGMGDGGVRGRLTNPPQYSLHRIDFEGAFLLVADVLELDPSYKPCFITDRGLQGGSYKRVDDADIPLSANEVYALQNTYVVSASDRKPVSDASVSDLDETLCEKTVTVARRTRARALKGAHSREVQLQRLNALDPDGRATKAGLLTLGVYPQQFFPKLHVDVAVHPGEGKAQAGKLRFVDRVICEGTIGEMIEDAVVAVTRNLRKRSTISGVGRIDEPEIPEEVLREAIANALVHREYDERFDGEAVSVDVFDDRVEVTNPGGLWGGKSKHNLDDGVSCCRSPTLMKLMSIVPMPNNAGAPVEGNGSGVLFMMQELASRGLEPPIFCPTFDRFKVVFKRGLIEIAKGRGSAIGEDFIRRLIAECGDMTVREIQEKSGLSVSQVRNRLRRMVANGEIEATASPTSRNRRYRLP